MRTISHDTHDGPGLLQLRLPLGAVTVVADRDTDRATVILIPERAGDRDAIDAINRAEAAQSGDLLAVTVVTGAAARAADIVPVGRCADGAAATATLAAPSAVSGGGGVRATVVVPSGQHVEIDAGSASVVATGPLAMLRVAIGAGDLYVQRAEDADLATGSGDIVLGSAVSIRASTGTGAVRVDRLRTGTVRSGLGDITARALDGEASLETDAGDVTAHLTAHAHVRARTGCGDVQVTAEPGITVDRAGLHTGCGEIRTS